MRPRVVLDTNLVISSLFGGIPAEVVKLWRDGRLTLLVTPEITSEYLANLAEFVTPRTLGMWRTALRRMTMAVRSGSVPRTATHPEDDAFLACAAAGRARYLATGDRPLLGLARFGVTRIVTARTLLEEINP